MPNWCSNNLELHSENKSKLEELRNEFVNQRLLNYLIPMPEELKKQDTDSLPKEERAKLEKENTTKYGSKDWWYWACKNWGTKWDVGPEGRDESSFPITKDGTKYSMSVEFDSAWSPPRNAINTLTNHAVDFKLTYYEGAVGFCGFISNNDGDDWDLSSGNATEAPQWIRDEFGIDEQFDDFGKDDKNE